MADGGTIWDDEPRHPVEKFMDAMRRYPPTDGGDKPVNYETLSAQALIAVCKTLYTPKPYGLGYPYPE